MLAQLAKRPGIAAAVTIIAGVVATLTNLPAFIDERLPWYRERVGVVIDILPGLVIALLIGAVVYFGLQYARYRSALRQVTRDYYAEKSQLEHEIDPMGHGEVSARLHSGRADPEWAGAIYDLYGVPREERYGD